MHIQITLPLVKVVVLYLVWPTRRKRRQPSNPTVPAHTRGGS